MTTGILGATFKGALDFTSFGYSTLSAAGYMAWNYPSTVLLTGRIGVDASSYFAPQETSKVSNLVQDCFASFTSWLPNPLRKIPQYHTSISKLTLATILKASKEIGSQDLKRSWPGFMQYLRACQIEWHRNLYTFIDGKCINPHRADSSAQSIRALAEKANLSSDKYILNTIQSKAREVLLSQQDSNPTLGELYQFKAQQITWGLFNWSLRYSVILAFEPCIPNYFNGMTKLVATIGFMYLLLPGKIASLSEPSSSTNALLDSEKINQIVAEASKHAGGKEVQIAQFRKELEGLKQAPSDFTPFTAPQILEEKIPQDPSQWKISFFLTPLWNLTLNCKGLVSKYASRSIPEWASQWIPERIRNAFSSSISTIIESIGLISERTSRWVEWIRNAFSPPISPTTESITEPDSAIIASIKEHDPAAQLDFDNINLSQEVRQLKANRKTLDEDSLKEHSLEWHYANILYAAVSMRYSEYKSDIKNASLFFQHQVRSTTKYFSLTGKPELILPYIQIKEEELKSKKWEDKKGTFDVINKIKGQYSNNNNA